MNLINVKKNMLNRTTRNLMNLINKKMNVENFKNLNESDSSL